MILAATNPDVTAMTAGYAIGAVTVGMVLAGLLIFESSRLLASGQRQFVYVEDTTASAGTKGDIEVPKELVLGLAPFEVGEAYKVTARIRYRLESGGLRLGYKLDRPEDILRNAFSDVVRDVQQRTSEDVLYGTPPQG